MGQAFDELRHQFDLSPYAKLLGMRVAEVSAGYVKITLTLPSTTAGDVAGHFRGELMSIADHAGDLAAQSLAERGHYVSVQLGISFVGEPLPGEQLAAEGHIAHHDAERGWMEVVILGADKRVLAKASGMTIVVGQARHPRTSPT